MKDMNEPQGTADDIDRIVEALVQDPSRADDMKSLLRQKLGAPDIIRVLRTDVPKSAETEEFEDPDELWDNLPV